MSKITIEKKELEALRSKAEKWDKLEAKISKYYCDDTGEYSEENPQIKGDLCDIGEVASMAFGLL